MPYHIFNIVSYIVLMQWVQLWAILYEAANLAERRSEFDKNRKSGISSEKRETTTMVTS